MKKLIYISFIAMSVIFQSCLKEDDDIFDKSASERMTETIAKYRADLLDSQYGWAMEYYAEKTQKYGGCMYTIQFKADSATVDYDLSDEDDKGPKSSLYNIVSDNGPVLTFDTYNEFMHHFAEPNMSYTDAREGDYEFVFMAQKGDSIILKGKKTGNTMVMYKLKEPAADFMAKVKASKSIISFVPRMSCTVNGTAVGIERTSSSFKFNDKGTTISVAYIATPTGVKLFRPITIDGVTFQSFDIDADEMGMTGVNADVKVKFIYPPVSEQIISATTQWFLSTDGSNMCDALKSELQNAINTDSAPYGETLYYLFIGKNIFSSSSTIPYGFMLLSGNYDAEVEYEMLKVDGTENQVSIKFTGKYGGSIEYYTSYINVFSLICENSPYVLTPDNEKSPTVVKFTSVADPSFWFVVEQ